MDLESIMSDVDDDKTFAAMGVAKTLATVSFISMCLSYCSDSSAQIVSSIENSPEILVQVQEVIIPIIMFTFENKLLGTLPLMTAVYII